MDQLNDENSDGRRVIRITIKKMVIAAVVIVILAIIAYAVPISQSIPNYGSYESGANSIPTASYDRYNVRESDISDTREFMKTSYSAIIRTRDVSKAVSSVKNIVKGADGRIDNINSSEKYGYVSFVVPKSKFDAFRDEIEAITHKKLYSENISSENLLGQKQNIEEQTTTIVMSLDTLKKQKEILDQKHSQTINLINNELSRIKSELSAIRINISNINSSTDIATVASWREQERVLVGLDGTERQKLSIENNNYANQKQNLEKQIASADSNLMNVNKQDVNFTNNIETVRGTVNVSWVSMWQLAKIYSPISPILIILILIILLWMYLNHKKITPKIVIG